MIINFLNIIKNAMISRIEEVVSTYYNIDKSIDILLDITNFLKA